MVADSALTQARDFVLARAKRRPAVGLILGSGLGGIADEIAEAEIIPYALIPHFPRPTVEGHKGEMVLGWMAGQAVAVLCGRLHYYEGYSMAEVAFPTRLLHALGGQVLIVTNAAGSLNPAFRPGDLMLIADHINLPGLAGASPLRGPGPAPGPAFVEMSAAYDPPLRQIALSVARRLGITLHQGTYAMVAGPSYETPAEVRLLCGMGADAVGMSTCPEVLAARQAGMRVLGLSYLTNWAASLGPAPFTHQEILAAGAEATPRLAALLKGVLAEMMSGGPR